MARTKKQKKMLAVSIDRKAFALFAEGLITAQTYEKIHKINVAVQKKLGY